LEHAVVRVQSPEEREYARYLTEIEVRKQRIAGLQAELAELRVNVGRFSAEYHARVGTLFVELDQIRLSIDEYERRIAWLQSHPGGDPATAEEEIEREFKSRREEVQAEQEESQQYEEAFDRERERPRLDANAEAEMRRLYLDLARRFHPDTAKTEEEKRRREPIMQRINAAFRDRDLEQLRTLAKEEDFIDIAFESMSIGEKLVWAIREVARLNQVVATLEEELKLVRASDIHQLWIRIQQGERVLESLEVDLNHEIAERRNVLATLIGTYRQLVDAAER
jgi:Skp family chaperone for outer membrane proteins